MSRVLKPLKVDSYYDAKRRISIDLMLDRNEKTFFAILDHKRLVAPSAQELIGEVKAELLKWKPPDWRRVIQLGVSEKKDESWWRSSGSHVSTTRAGLEIHFSRKEVATLSEGRMIERPFREDVPAAWHADFDEDALSYSSSCYDDANQIPYTEEAWSTLNECVNALEKAQARLEVLFNPKDGGRLLAARALGGVPLLGTGKE